MGIGVLGMRRPVRCHIPRSATVARPGVRAVVCALGAWAAIGCSADWHREDADKEVYTFIGRQEQGQFGRQSAFSIEPDARSRLAHLGAPASDDLGRPIVNAVAAPSGPTAAASQPAWVYGTRTHVLSLPEAMHLAVLNSREFQRQKEEVYLAALTYTLEKHQFATIYGATVSGTLERDTDREGTVGADGTVTASKLFATGGTAAVSLGSSFSRTIRDLLTHGRTATSLLSLDLSQPLWRGAGQRIVLEDLTQAQRNAIYRIREFARFRKTFCVDIATRYLRALQQQQVADNERANYGSLQAAEKQTRRMSEAGRLPDFQVDQATQDVLRSRSRWIVAVEGAKNQLDRLKLRLGLPTDAPAALVRGELMSMTKRGLRHPDLDEAEAVKTGLISRIDLMNRRAAVWDAERRVVVARDGLKGELSLSGQARLTTPTVQPYEFDGDRRGTYTGTVDVDLPLDRKAERNAYRQSLIDRERARRSLSELEDNVKLAVREALRGLTQAEQTYRIQQSSLKLANRRVASTGLLLQAGRASTRDLLESQAALLEAQNSVIRSLVDHTIARLELWRDLGTLRVDARGMWNDDAIVDGAGR